MVQVGRGGDLYIRYPDGTLRNLTAEAGFGVPTGFQGVGAIAVRDPAVHWSGTRAVFSMVIGAPTEEGVFGEYYWQLYEVTGLAQGQTATSSPRTRRDRSSRSPRRRPRTPRTSRSST